MNIDELFKKYEFEPFKLSFCPSADTFEKQEKALMGWRPPFIIANEDQFIDLVTSRPYSQTIFRPYEEIPKDITKKKDGKEYLAKSNQRTIRNAIGITDTFIVDIDNGLTIPQAKEKMDAFGKKYCIISTKSHQKEGKGDRFRIFLFLQWEKVPENAFHTTGLLFNETSPESKRRQLVEIEFLKFELAKSLGFVFDEKITEQSRKTDEIDVGALKDISRKYMPSPKRESENFVFISRWDLPKLDIGEFAPIVKKRANDRLLQITNREVEIKARFKTDIGINQVMMENPTWKYVYDKKMLFAANPFDIVYQYESEIDPNTTMLHEYSDRPRVKRRGVHEFAIYYNPASGEYTIHDFVGAQHYNILSYLKMRFPALETFELMLKVQNDFSHILGSSKLIHDNPYYYLSQAINVLADENVKNYEQYIGALKEGKVANSIFVDINRGYISVEKTNGWNMKFQILDEATLPNHVSKKDPMMKELNEMMFAFSKRNREYSIAQQNSPEPSLKR